MFGYDGMLGDQKKRLPDIEISHQDQSLRQQPRASLVAVAQKVETWRTHHDDRFTMFAHLDYSIRRGCVRRKMNMSKLSDRMANSFVNRPRNFPAFEVSDPYVA